MSSHQVIFRGGLGNQLFCLFHSYKIAIIQKNRVYINLTNYGLLNRSNRSFILDILYPKLLEEFELSSPILSRFLLIYSRIFEKIFLDNYPDRLPGDKSFKIKYFPNKFVHSGYFQQINNSELDMNSLKLIKSRLSPYLIGEKNNNLAIHIRRGDYLSKRHSLHGIIDQKYLFKASKKLLKKKDFSGITIFSDSPELIDLNYFKLLNKNVIIDVGGDPIDVFKRMANHKGLIASNSSFSLWAGILGEINNFSIPYYWMKNVKSSIIGLEDIPRYKCEI